MTLLFSANNTPTTFPEYLYNLKQLLVAAGWTIPRASTGLAYNPSGDNLTSAALLSNPGAWFVVQMPSYGGVTRQLCFQRSTNMGGGNDSIWRVKYSYAAGFSGGSPAATQTPSATDEQILLGAGTDSAPTFSTWMQGSAGTNRMHAGADATAPYGFWAAAYPTGGGNPTWAMLLEPMAAGSYPSADVDPYVLYCGGSSSLALSDLSNATNVLDSGGSAGSPQCYFKKGLSGEAFRTVAAAQMMNNVSSLCAPSSLGGLGSNPHTGKEDLLPMIWSRYAQLSTPPTGFKGYGSLAQWRTSVRATGDTYSLAATSDRMILRDVVVPWNGTTPLV